MTKCSYTRAPREGKIKPRFFLHGWRPGGRAPCENRQGSIRFASPPLARVRAESGAREGFLGDITSDTMFEAFYKTANMVSEGVFPRKPSRASGSASSRREAGEAKQIEPFYFCPCEKISLLCIQQAKLKRTTITLCVI